MNKYKRYQLGFSLIELMVSTVIGLLISYTLIEIYVAQTQIYKTTNSQDLIQNAENAIANVLTPIIRSAGFSSCASISTAISNLNGGGSNPIGNLSTNPTMLMGYNGSGKSFTISQDNSANDSNPNNWVPSLDSGLAGAVQPNNDVLVVLGGVPGSSPATLSVIDSGSSSMTLQSSTSTITSGQFAAVSDCAKTSIFQITGVAGTSISHVAGTGPYANAKAAFTVNYQPGAQFLPLQQTAFFVGQGPGGQSALMRALLTTTGWAIQPLVAGIDVMKVEYGIGNNGTVSQYVTADAVTDWAQVYALRLGFLIEGQVASESLNTKNYTVLDTVVTVPTDNRLRHVYEININLRNGNL